MSGERVGGVKYENEPSLSREMSEAPEDLLLDVLGTAKGSWVISATEWSEVEEFAVDGLERLILANATVGEDGI